MTRARIQSIIERLTNWTLIVLGAFVQGIERTLYARSPSLCRLGLSVVQAGTRMVAAKGAMSSMLRV